MPGLLSLPVYPARVAGGVLCINPFAHKHGKNEQKKEEKRRGEAKDVPGSVRSLFVVPGNEPHIKPDIIKLSGLF